MHRFLSLLILALLALADAQTAFIQYRQGTGCDGTSPGFDCISYHFGNTTVPINMDDNTVSYDFMTTEDSTTPVNVKGLLAALFQDQSVQRFSLTQSSPSQINAIQFDGPAGVPLTKLVRNESNVLEEYTITLVDYLTPTEDSSSPNGKLIMIIISATCLGCGLIFVLFGFVFALIKEKERKKKFQKMPKHNEEGLVVVSPVVGGQQVALDDSTKSSQLSQSQEQESGTFKIQASSFYTWFQDLGKN